MTERKTLKSPCRILSARMLMAQSKRNLLVAGELGYKLYVQSPLCKGPIYAGLVTSRGLIDQLLKLLALDL